MRIFASKFMGNNGLKFFFIKLGSVPSFFLKDLCKIGVKCLNIWKHCSVKASRLGELFFKNFLIKNLIYLIIIELFSLSVEFWWFIQGTGLCLLSGWIYEHYEHYWALWTSVSIIKLLLAFFFSFCWLWDLYWHSLFCYWYSGNLCLFYFIFVSLN